MKEKIKHYLDCHQEAFDILVKDSDIIEQAGSIILNALNNGGKVLFMGNGGSAADSQHLAAEFVGRFRRDRRPLPAIALTTDTSIITAIGNDYGYDEIFTRQLEALAQPNDVIVGISTSGNSTNIIDAMAVAKTKGLKTIGFLGKDGGILKNMVDVAIHIPLQETSYVQEMHILAGHIICEIVESELFDKK